MMLGRVTKKLFVSSSSIRNEKRCGLMVILLIAGRRFMYAVSKGWLNGITGMSTKTGKSKLEVFN